MQSRPVRLAMYGVCVLFCIGYAVDALLELMSPERSANMIALMGQTPYYLMTVARMVVLLVTGGAFGRMLIKVAQEK